MGGEEFRKFIVENKLAHPDKSVYFERWVEKWRHFMRMRGLRITDKALLEFLEELSRREVPDWQIRQAHTACQLYFKRFIPAIDPTRIVEGGGGRFLPRHEAAALLEDRGVVQGVDKPLRLVRQRQKPR